MNATTSNRRPGLLVAVGLCVAIGALASGAAQAGAYSTRDAGSAESTERWWQSIWGLDLARKLKEWRPSITVSEDAEGLNLAHPFGKSGPTLQCSSSMPASVLRSLHAVGGHRIGSSVTDTELFLFLQKRW